MPCYRAGVTTVIGDLCALPLGWKWHGLVTTGTRLVTGIGTPFTLMPHANHSWKWPEN